MQTYFDMHGFNEAKDNSWREVFGETLQILLAPSRLVIFWRNWKCHLKLVSNHGTSYPDNPQL